MSEHDNHGQSTASWTGTGVILLGCLMVSLGLVLTWSWLWIAGAVVTIAGVAAWVGLEKAGKGATAGQKDANRG